MLRKPAVAGQFYAGTREKLKEEIRGCFLDSRGPGSLPEKGEMKLGIKGAVAPHAGYMYSGAIAAHSYKAIAEDGFADTFIILGPNHTGMGSGVSLYHRGEWETPFGKVPIDEEIAKKLLGGIIDMDEDAHRYEHSIEVQLPFLQFIEENFSIVPICMAMQDVDTSKEVGEALARAIKDSDKRVVVIASTDFSHVGLNYMNSPPRGKGVDEYAREQDKKAIDKILEMDPEGLIERVYSERISMCGYGCVAAMLFAVRELGARNAKLLKYGTSYEVVPGESCVGYGALIVY
ncbi:MAG: hypothetical protein DRN00_00780 [Thermoplasmata archaeon]|nr:MAG: hypothetical protein DRN00_00780 [Thermoplasmata archaeon]